MVSAILVLAGVLAFCGMLYGVVAVGAGSMSDDPIRGDAAAFDGLVWFLVSGVIFLAVVVVGIWRWWHGL